MVTETGASHILGTINYGCGIQTSSLLNSSFLWNLSSLSLSFVSSIFTYISLIFMWSFPRYLVATGGVQLLLLSLSPFSELSLGVWCLSQSPCGSDPLASLSLFSILARRGQATGNGHPFDDFTTPFDVLGPCLTLSKLSCIRPVLPLLTKVGRSPLPPRVQV